MTSDYYDYLSKKPLYDKEEEVKKLKSEIKKLKSENKELKEQGRLFVLDITSLRYGLSQAVESLNGLSSNVCKISKDGQRLMVEIKSLDNLIDFMKEQKNPLIIEENESGELQIEIYNDYRE